MSRRLAVRDYLKEYKALTTDLPSQLNEQGFGGNGYMGGQADLTPLKNRAREASEALNDAQKAADAGRAEDALEAMRRARAAIDAALGGGIGPHGAMTPPPGGAGGPGRY
jgi:hypothetical protein